MPEISATGRWPRGYIYFLDELLLIKDVECFWLPHDGVVKQRYCMMLVWLKFLLSCAQQELTIGCGEKTYEVAEIGLEQSVRTQSLPDLSLRCRLFLLSHS